MVLEKACPEWERWFKGQKQEDVDLTSLCG